MIDRCELDEYLKRILEVERFRDYGPNGLQVEGRSAIKRIVTGVTASLALLEAAIDVHADAVIVHHGLFWRGQDGRIVTWMKQRLAAILKNDLNLFAYHLPLDAHPLYGNNAQLGRQFGWQIESQFGEQNLGYLGSLTTPTTLPELIAQLEHHLGRNATYIGREEATLQRIAWCSGGAQNYFEAAIDAGADVFITGELSEPQTHLARETGVAFVACGHHATERYGVMALGQHLANQFALEHHFIDIPNPA